MVTVVQAATATQRDHARALLWEYLQWANGKNRTEFGISFDIEAMLEHDLASQEFVPPGGALLIAYDAGVPAGCVCLRTIGPGLAEVKRLYVPPAHRRRGIGRRLATAVVAQARAAGCGTLRLDSPTYMTDAHALYRALGFREVRPYAESEIPAQYHDRWLFMALPL